MYIKNIADGLLLFNFNTINKYSLTNVINFTICVSANPFEYSSKGVTFNIINQPTSNSEL